MFYTGRFELRELQAFASNLDVTELVPTSSEHYKQTRGVWKACVA
jgi:hypothetical protein